MGERSKGSEHRNNTGDGHGAEASIACRLAQMPGCSWFRTEPRLDPSNSRGHATGRLNPHYCAADHQTFIIAHLEHGDIHVQQGQLQPSLPRRRACLTGGVHVGQTRGPIAPNPHRMALQEGEGNLSWETEGCRQARKAGNIGTGSSVKLSGAPSYTKARVINGMRAMPLSRTCAPLHAE